MLCCPLVVLQVIYSRIWYFWDRRALISRNSTLGSRDYPHPVFEVPWGDCHGNETMEQGDSRPDCCTLFFDLALDFWIFRPNMREQIKSRVYFYLKKSSKSFFVAETKLYFQLSYDTDFPHSLRYTYSYRIPEINFEVFENLKIIKINVWN